MTIAAALLLCASPALSQDGVLQPEILHAQVPEVQLVDGRVLPGIWKGQAVRDGFRTLRTPCGELRVPVIEVRESSAAAEGEAPGDLNWQEWVLGIPEESTEGQYGVWREVETRHLRVVGDVPALRLEYLAERAEAALLFDARFLGLEARLAKLRRRPLDVAVFSDREAYLRNRAHFAISGGRRPSRAAEDAERGWFGLSIAVWDPGGELHELRDAGLAVLQHELAHFVLEELGGARPQPLWAHEGLATLLEHLRWHSGAYHEPILTPNLQRRATAALAWIGAVSLDSLAAVGPDEFGLEHKALAASLMEYLRDARPELFAGLLDRLGLEPGAAVGQAPRAELVDEGWLEYLEALAEELAEERSRLAFLERGERLRDEAEELLLAGELEAAAALCAEFLARPEAGDLPGILRQLVALRVEALARAYSLSAADGPAGARAARTALERAEWDYPIDRRIAGARALYAVAALERGAISPQSAGQQVARAVLLGSPDRPLFSTVLPLARALGEYPRAREVLELLIACEPQRREEIELAWYHALLEAGDPEDLARWLELVEAGLERSAGAVDPGTALDAAAIARQLGRFEEAVDWARLAVVPLEAWWTRFNFAPSSPREELDASPEALETIARRLLQAGAIETECLVKLKRFEEAESVQRRMARCLEVVPDLGPVWSERVEDLGRLLGI